MTDFQALTVYLETAIGDTVELTVLRNGALITIPVTLLLLTHLGIRAKMNLSAAEAGRFGVTDCQPLPCRRFSFGPERDASGLQKGTAPMPQQTDPRQLSLAGIAHRCAQETARFFERQAYDPRYCFELFRRAVVERDESAWGLVYTQYRPLVAGWVERHTAFPASGEEIQYFVNRAFEKIWSALSPEKFSKFPNLKALLRYLQMCVHSVVLDQVRVSEKAALGLESHTAAAVTGAGQTTVEGQAVDRIHQEEFWQEINARLQDERERCVIYGSFVLALKPREICARFPDVFDNVKAVYRVKENVLARLRRDPELKKLLGEYA